MKVEHFHQLNVKFHSRKRCKQVVLKNVNTSYASSDQCKKNAHFLINNVPYCNAHAGTKCLEEALRVTEASIGEVVK